MAFSLREAINIFQLLLIRGTGMLSLFLVNVIVARNFGPATQGLFQIGLGWVIVIATVSRFGQDQLMLRTAAEGKARNDIVQVNRHLSASLVLAVVALAVGTATALLFIQLGGFKIDGKNGALFLSIMVLAILPTGVLMIVTEAMRGWQKVSIAIAWQGGVPQTLVMLILLLTVLVNRPNSLLNPIWTAVIYTTAFFAACLCACFAWIRIAKIAFGKPSISEISQKLKEGSHFWFYAILTSMIAWVDILLLGLLDSAEAVGHYSTIVRTGAVLGTIVQILSAGAIARLALFYAQADYKNFTSLFRSYFQFFAICAVPLTVIILIYPSQIMSIWGHNFASDDQLFLIYGSFQIINFATCLAGFTVVVIGLERKLVRMQVAMLIFKFGAIVALHNFMGLEGVVWAIGASLLLTNLLTYRVFVKAMSDLDVSSRSLFVR
jgi:O-antigen/teichoic acid export membrane protein